MSVNEEFLNEALQELCIKTVESTGVGNPLILADALTKAEEAILQHFQQEQECLYCHAKSPDGKVWTSKGNIYTQVEVDRLIREARIEELVSIEAWVGDVSVKTFAGGDIETIEERLKTLKNKYTQKSG